jgi:hypothetical protein
MSESILFTAVAAALPSWPIREKAAPMPRLACLPMPALCAIGPIALANASVPSALAPAFLLTVTRASEVSRTFFTSRPRLPKVRSSWASPSEKPGADPPVAPPSWVITLDRPTTFVAFRDWSCCSCAAAAAVNPPRAARCCREGTAWFQPRPDNPAVTESLASALSRAVVVASA